MLASIINSYGNCEGSGHIYGVRGWLSVKTCDLFFPPSLPPDLHLSQLLLEVMVLNLSVVAREFGVGLSDTVIF